VSTPRATTEPQTAASRPPDNLTEAEARRRAAAVTDLHYVLRLDLADDPGTPTFRSTTSIRFRCPRGAVTTFLDLNTGEPGRLLGVRIDGHAAPAALRDYTGARLPLPELAAGIHTLEVTAECTYSHVGTGVHRAVDPVDSQSYLYTHSEPFEAHKIFACFDQPDLKGTFDVSVRAPLAWEVCANGRVLGCEEDREGWKLWRFKTTPPLPTYLVAIAAGDFHVMEARHRGIRLGLYCRRSMAPYLEDQAAEIWEVTRQCLDFYAEEFGFAYPFDEYDQVFVPEFNAGAMENPGCVTFHEMYIFRSRATEAQRSRRAEVVAHEMAHVCGFGDVATMRWWGDLWLNETFATFMATRAMTAATEFKKGWVDFANTMKAAAARQDQLPSTHPVSTPCVDTDMVRQNFDGITYYKGGSVLKQLVAWVGDEPFTAGVRDYFRRYRWSNADLSEFLACLEEASGRDLAAWSREWLQTSGINTLRPELSLDDGRITSFAVLQSAPPDHPTLRSHRVRVGLYRLEGDRLVRYRQEDADIRGERTPIPTLEGEKAADLVVVNDDDLTFCKLRFDETSTRTLIQHLGGLADPLARALCWAALWDMTRDAELATRDFVATVLHHARVETEVTVLERLLSQALTAIDQFGDPANRSTVREAVATTAWETLSAAEPGADHQLTWMRAYIAAVDGEPGLERLEHLLDGGETVPGLGIDTDLRWMIVARLAGSARNAAARIDVQLAADDTDHGRRRAAACRSARPDAEAKAEAWAEITERPEIPLQMLESIMAGFGVGAFPVGGFLQWDATQVELGRPYAERWAKTVVQFWARRDREEAEAFTDLLYPRPLVEPATLRLAESVLAAIDASSLSEPAKRDARRQIVESRDGTARALRARSRDARASGVAAPAGDDSLEAMGSPH
jgi:aminopeptidase N